MATGNAFKLFVIAPKFEGFEPGRESPETFQRCSRGHVWNLGMDFVGVELDLSDLGLTDGTERFCFLCLRDLLREHCGRVPEVR